MNLPNLFGGLNSPFPNNGYARLSCLVNPYTSHGSLYKITKYGVYFSTRSLIWDMEGSLNSLFPRNGHAWLACYHYMPFDIWLHSVVILFYSTLSRWYNSLNKKDPKTIIRKKTATDRRRSLFVLFSFISWVQQPFNGWRNFPRIQLKWLNSAARVSKNTLIVSWYTRVLIWYFKAFNMVLVAFGSLCFSSLFHFVAFYISAYC